VGSESGKGTGLNLAEVAAVLLLSVILSFRYISLPLVAAAVVVARRAGRRSVWAIAVRCAFFLSLLSPVDINLLGMYRHGGVHRSGPRLVRCVVGMPAHTALVSRYGEYYSLGCSGYTMNSPRWMLVLR
jgi:hypothetical protein